MAKIITQTVVYIGNTRDSRQAKYVCGELSIRIPIAELDRPLPRKLVIHIGPESEAKEDG